MKAATARTAAGFQNILFATDFSDASARAIPHIKEMAKHYEANLVVLQCQRLGQYAEVPNLSNIIHEVIFLK